MRVSFFTQDAVERLSGPEAVNTTALRYFVRETNASESEGQAYLGRWGLGGKLATATSIDALSGGQKVGFTLLVSGASRPGLSWTSRRGDLSQSTSKLDVKIPAKTTYGSQLRLGSRFRLHRPAFRFQHILTHSQSRLALALLFHQPPHLLSVQPPRAS